MARAASILLLLLAAVAVCSAIQMPLTRKTVVRDYIRDHLIQLGYPRDRAFTQHYLRSAADESLLGGIASLGEFYLDLPIGTNPVTLSLQCMFFSPFFSPFFSFFWL
jgi:hypothetical protein